MRVMIHGKAPACANSASSSSKLELLPIEIKNIIFSYLNLGTVHNILPFVCSHLEELVTEYASNTVLSVAFGKVIGGMGDGELRQICINKPNVRSLVYNGRNLGSDWSTVTIPVILTEFLLGEWWQNLTELVIVGHYSDCLKKMLLGALRAGELRRLLRLKFTCEPALECADVVSWDTPNLESLVYSTGCKYWEFFDEWDFQGLFTGMRKLRHYGLFWHPRAPDDDEDEDDLLQWPNPMNTFLENAEIPDSVQSLQLETSAVREDYDRYYPHTSLKFSTLSGVWPNVKRLQIRVFSLLRNEILSTLRCYPSLEELFVEFPNVYNQFIGETYKNAVLSALGNGWTDYVSLRPRAPTPRVDWISFRRRR
jgi:hypothetical protein